MIYYGCMYCEQNTAGKHERDYPLAPRPKKKQQITPPRYDKLYFDEMANLDQEDIYLYDPT